MAGILRPSAMINKPVSKIENRLGNPRHECRYHVWHMVILNYPVNTNCPALLDMFREKIAEMNWSVPDIAICICCDRLF